MVDRNAEIPEDERITFRIGVNLGDVIIDGDDIHGDGANIAARLVIDRRNSMACRQCHKLLASVEVERIADEERAGMQSDGATGCCRRNGRSACALTLRSSRPSPFNRHSPDSRRLRDQGRPFDRLGQRKSRSPESHPVPSRNRKFESSSLQRRESCKPSVPQHWSPRRSFSGSPWLLLPAANSRLASIDERIGR
jgi:hypothetical protein